MTPLPTDSLRLALPKGRMQEAILTLFADAGIPVRHGARGYRPRVPLPAVDAKILKPQTIVEMLALGVRDAGFAGADWVRELVGAAPESGPIEALDTGLDPVRLVVAAPRELLERGRLPERPLLVASEYPRLAQEWIARRCMGDSFVRSFGATEVFPPDDADCILDVTQTGATLEANGLAIVEDVLISSTRLYVSRAAWNDPGRRATVDTLVLLLRSALDARGRVMLELNVDAERLADVLSALPAMREPTLSPLSGRRGFAVKAAVRRDQLAELIPALKRQGGADLVVTPLVQVSV
ncbi:MAG: ATP phosphoribosyltransferase [Phycisphaerae bacterium]|nr:ATP phosphoribosyltransferase [Phycisphaerae bacterium]